MSDLEIAAGLGAMRVGPQQLGPPRVQVQGMLEFNIEGNRYWVGDITANGQTQRVRATLNMAQGALELVFGSKTGVPVMVSGSVVNRGSQQNGLPIYEGPVTVRVGQKTNVSANMFAYVQPSQNQNARLPPSARQILGPVSPRLFSPEELSQRPALRNDLVGPGMPTCQPGQVMYGKKKNGTVVQLDADFYEVLRIDPTARAEFVQFWCAWPGPGYQWGGLHGLSDPSPHGSGETPMTMQVAHDHDLQLAAGLGALFAVEQGLGILGDPKLREKVPADTYEITGTQVALRKTPNGEEIGRLNNRYGQNNNLVVEPVDLIETNAQVAYNVGGHNWAEGTIKNGELAGQKGFVATDYLGGIGYTKAHNGTGPIAGGGGGGGITPVSDKTSTTTETDYTPYILGGAAVLGLGIIGWAVLAKPKRGTPHRAGRRRRISRHMGRRRAR